MAPVMLDLPDELLLQIVAGIEDHGDAAHVAICCRRLQGLVDMHQRRRFRRFRFVPNRRTTRVQKRLVEILRRPELGYHVRHIELDCFYGHGANGFLSRDGLSDGDVALLCEAIKDAGIVDVESDKDLCDLIFPSPVAYQFDMYHWNEGPLHRTMEIFAALLVSLSPGVTSISSCDLGFYRPRVQIRLVGDHNVKSTGSQSYFGRFLQRASRPYGRKKYLQKLRKVHLLSDTTQDLDERYYNRINYYHIWNVTRRLPAIESIRFDASTDWTAHNPVPPPPCSANYSKIAFYHSSVPSQVLNNIIRSTRALAHLTLSIGGRALPGGGHIAFELDPLLDTLLEYRATLKYLDINADDEISFRACFSDSSEGWNRPEAEPFNEEYAEEWTEELAALSLSDVDPSGHESQKPTRSLRSLHCLKHLGLGIYTMYYLARGIGKDRLGGSHFNLVDQLPSAIESLRIYGIGQRHMYEREEMRLRVDWHVSQLMRQKDAKLPLLENIVGLDRPIPNGQSVKDPDGDIHLLWERKLHEWSEDEDDTIGSGRGGRR